MLTILALMSLNCFSQTDTSKIKTDTTKVILSQQVAKRVVKDLIRLDGCEEELKLTQIKVAKLEEVVVYKDSTINLYIDKDKNNQYIIQQQEKQLKISEDLSKSLQKDLRKQRTQTFLYKLGTVVLGLTTTYFLITN